MSRSPIAHCHFIYCIFSERINDDDDDFGCYSLHAPLKCVVPVLPVQDGNERRNMAFSVFLAQFCCAVHPCLLDVGLLVVMI